MGTEKKKAIILSWKIVATIEWKCPFCGNTQIYEYEPTPYHSVTSDNPPQTICSCGTPIHLDFLNRL
jgi:hypothetical protein